MFHPFFSLYCCILTVSFLHAGEIYWVVEKKVTEFGQNLVLFCKVNNCCPLYAGWDIGTTPIIIDVKQTAGKPFGPGLRYESTYKTSGYSLVIKNLTENDLNRTYTCSYGFDRSKDSVLRKEDAFREKHTEASMDQHTNLGLIIGASLGVFGGAGLTVVGIILWKRRKKVYKMRFIRFMKRKGDEVGKESFELREKNIDINIGDGIAKESSELHDKKIKINIEDGIAKESSELHDKKININIEDGRAKESSELHDKKININIGDGIAKESSELRDQKVNVNIGLKTPAYNDTEAHGTFYYASESDDDSHFTDTDSHSISICMPVNKDDRISIKSKKSEILSIKSLQSSLSIEIGDIEIEQQRQCNK